MSVPPPESGQPTLAIQHMPVLDHVRALAALLVLAFHLRLHFPGIPLLSSAWVLALLRQGYVGVSLFLALSGFLFMRLALERGVPQDALGFLRNRMLRVAPLFIVVYVLAVSINRDAFRPGDLGYVLITNIGKPPTSENFATGTAWSISLELAFYVIFPFLARFVLEGGLGYLARLILLCLVFKLAAFGLSASGKLVMYSTLIGRMDQFLLGMGAAILSFRWRHHGGVRRWRLALIGVIAGLLAYGAWLEAHAPYPSPANEWEWVLIPSVEGLLFSALILCSLQARIRTWGWLDRALCWVALVSYSLYLLHPLAILLVKGLIERGLLRWSDGVAGAAAAILALLLACLSYHTIESPFLRLKRRPSTAQSSR